MAAARAFLRDVSWDERRERVIHVSGRESIEAPSPSVGEVVCKSPTLGEFVAGRDPHFGLVMDQY